MFNKFQGRSPYDATHWIGPEGYLCPSDVKYAMPKRARNVNGEWRVVVNDVHYYTQTARMETCLTPGKLAKTNLPPHVSVQPHCRLFFCAESIQVLAKKMRDKAVLEAFLKRVSAL